MAGFKTIQLIFFAAEVDHLEQSAPKCFTAAVQGADPGTAKDAGSVRGPHSH